MNNKGFTVIELIVVVGILLLLVGLAVPVYNNYRLSSNRSVAKTALITMAQTLERQFVRTGSYSGVALPTTEHGLYILDYPTGTLTANTFTVRATAAGTQVGDTNCNSFTIDNFGNRLSYDDTPAVSTNCW